MSLFGDRLRSLISDSGINILRLSEITGIERTSIHKIMSDGRLPSLDAVYKLSDALQLPSEEHDSFLELYTISKIGMQTYNQRKQIKALIESIASLDLRQDKSTDRSAIRANPYDFNKSHITVKTSYETDALISNIMLEAINSKGKPGIDFFISEEYGYFYDELLSLCIGKSNVRIRNIAAFSKKQGNESLQNTNISALARLMPLCLCSEIKYEPYYCYKNSPYLEITQVMPYFVLTSTGKVVLISKDFTQASMISDASLVEIYKDNFEQMIKNSKPLIKGFDKVLDYIDFCIDIVSKDSSSPFYSIVPAPPMEWYVSEQQIDSLIKRLLPLRGKLIKLATRFFSIFKNNRTDSIVICSTDGATKLIRDKVLSFTPNEIMNPIPAELIKEKYNEIHNEVSNDVFSLYFTNPSKFVIPDNTVFHIGRGSGVTFARKTHQEAFRAIHITEDSIRNAFIDFVESVSDIGLVYNKDASLEMLEAIINS